MVENVFASVEPPLLTDVRLFERSPDHLSFIWSEIPSDCPNLHYRIGASNCGDCPNVTYSTNATCEGNYADVDDNMAQCLFSVQAVVCDIAGNASTAAVNVTLSGTSAKFMYRTLYSYMYS